MQKQVKCPRCKTPQPLGGKCVSCGLDFREYARKLKEKRAQEGAQKKIKCPWCKTVQPLGDKCVSCGLDFKEYAKKVKSGEGAVAPQPPEQPSEAPAGETAGEEAAVSAKDKFAAKPQVKSAFAKELPNVKIVALPREPELSTVGELLQTTWLIYKDRLLVLVGLYLLAVVCLLVPMGATFGAGMLTAMTWPGSFVALLIVSMFGGLIGLLAWFWAFAGFVSAACDETQKFKEALGSGWRNMWSLLWLYLMVGYVVQGGFLLLFIPGIVWMVSFFAAQFIIFEEGVTGMTAMLKSRAYVKGHWWAVFGRLLLIMVLMVVASVIPFGGILFTPFMMLYMVLLYKDLRTIKGKELEFKPSAGEKAKYIVFATLGFAIPVVLFIVFVGTAVFKNIPDLKNLDLKDLQSIATKDFSQIERMEIPVPGQAEQEAQAGPQVSYEPEIQIDRASFAPGETIVVHFKAPSTFTPNAWVGIVPSTVPHASEAENSRGSRGKQQLEGRTSGDLTFTAPSEPGIYDVRMYDSGAESASATFAVEARAPKQKVDSSVKIKTTKSSYFPGEPVEIEFSGLPGYSQDWITLVPATASESTYGEWFYTGGVKAGRHTFSGLQPGRYEVRVYFDWPDGGYNVRARQTITVGQ